MAFSSSFRIGNRLVGGDAPVLVIGEAGVAHFGDLGKGLALVDLAAGTGCDVFKTQAFSTEALISSRLPHWRQRLASKEVGYDFLARLKERCDQRGIVFICTAHDETVLPWLEQLAVPAYKVGSGERGNLPFIMRIASLGKPVILSTGMYEAQDIGQTLDAVASVGCEWLALLHCVTSYPTPAEQVNLRSMEFLRSVFPGPVGYSDHTEGELATLAAVAMGASVVEKHISLDFNVPNAQDWKVSAGPGNLAGLVSKIRTIEKMRGQATKQLQACEEGALTWALKSLVAARDIPAGTILKPEHIASKRPGGGISPAEIDKVVGRRLRTSITIDQAISWDHLATS